MVPGVGSGRGISVWYVANNEMYGDMRSEDKKGERNSLCKLDRV